MSSVKPSGERVSVVIPLYNHGNYIGEAVRSALDQTVPPAEIIVVDDGSTDDSAARMRELYAQHPQIIFWSQPNQGAHNAINAGIHRATGKYVSILNSDDAYTPTRLEECLAALEKDDGASAVATGMTFIDETSATTTNPWYEEARLFYVREGDLSLALIRDNFFVTTSNLFLRKSVFEEIGYFSPLRYTHDLDFILRLLACGKRVQFLDKPLLKYRMHGGNTIREDSAGTGVERAAVAAFYLQTAWLQRARNDWPAYLRRLEAIARERALGVLLADFLEHLGPSPEAGQVLGPWTRDLEFRRYTRETFGTTSDSAEQSAREARLLRETQRLADALLKLEAESAAQKVSIEMLEKANRWLSGQKEQIEEVVAEQKKEIDSQRDWIGTLEEAKQWQAEQNEHLRKETTQLQAMLSEQKNWIGVLDQSNKQLIEKNRQLHEEIGEIRRSLLWRILRALRMTPGRPE